MITPVVAMIVVPAVGWLVSEYAAWNPSWRSNSAGQLLYYGLQGAIGAVFDKLRDIAEKK